MDGLVGGKETNALPRLARRTDRQTDVCLKIGDASERELEHHCLLRQAVTGDLRANGPYSELDFQKPFLNSKLHSFYLRQSRRS